MTAEEKAQLWLSSSKIDDESRKEIIRLRDEDPNTFNDAFYKDLDFGTGGLRGIMGVGTNRMNKYTLGMATQGLANYLSKIFQNEEIKVAIAYDSRNNSRRFAETTANVFSAKLEAIMAKLSRSGRMCPKLYGRNWWRQPRSGICMRATTSI